MVAWYSTIITLVKNIINQSKIYFKKFCSTPLKSDTKNNFEARKVLQIPVNGIMIIFHYLKYQKCKVCSLFLQKLKTMYNIWWIYTRKSKLQCKSFIQGLFSSHRLYDASECMPVIVLLNPFISVKENFNGRYYSRKDEL